MKFNIGDKLHISGDITVTGAYKCGDGIYSYNTDVGTFHEPALDKLVCAAAASVKPYAEPSKPTAPEPKPFKHLYSGKVVCVETHDDFTVGKVYTFTLGKVTDDSWTRRPMSSFVTESLEDWNSRCGDCIARFIEYKGDAT